MVSNDIMMAVLSMDTYSRGPDARNAGEGFSETGSIGLYDIVTSSIPSAYAQSFSFYGLAYQKGGETVISYRGTHGLAPDAWFGYGIGGGQSSGVHASQGNIAIDMYEQVTGRDVHQLGAAPNVTLVGHSLGGGLAGYVASLSGAQAVVFDYMPFRAAAIAKAQEEVDLRSAMKGSGNSEAYGVRLPDLNTVKSFSLEGELLEPLRTATGPAVDLYRSIFGGNQGGVYNRVMSSYDMLGSASVSDLEGQRNHTTIANETSFTTVPNALTLHSQALLIMHMFAEEEWDWSNWRVGAEHVLDHIFDDDIGSAVGRVEGPSSTAASNTGTDSAGGQMSRLIAYSVVDEGSMPAGNVGIRAMMDDMNDLGAVSLSLGSSNSWFNEHAGNLGRIIVNFAGRMAAGKVVASQDDGEDDDGDWDPDAPIDEGGADEDVGPDVLSGAISTSEYFDFTTNETKITSITVDASRALWNQGLFDRSSADLNATQALVSSDNRQIIGLGDILSAAVDDATSSGISLLSAMVLHYGKTVPQILGNKVFDTYTFVVGDGGMMSVQETDGVAFTKVVSAAGYTLGSVGADVMQAWSGGSILYGMGGKDVMVGGIGNDTLVGGAGSLIYGGAGNDVLGAEMGYTSGQDASARIDGGEGYDILQYGGAVDGIVVDAANSTVTLGSRVDTYVGIERIEGGYGNNVFNGNGKMQFEGSIGDDTFNLKVGDWARGGPGGAGSGGAGQDVVSFTGVYGGISMSAGGLVTNFTPGDSLSRVNDVDVIIGSDDHDSFTAEKFDKGELDTIRFIGGGGSDTFDLYDLSIASGGAGSDTFYVHLDPVTVTQFPSIVRIEDFKSEDRLFVTFGGTSTSLTGNQVSVSFRTVSTDSYGSYDLIETTVGSSPFAAAAVDRYIGHYGVGADGVGTFLKSESAITSPLPAVKYDYFEFDALSSTGVLNIKVAGYREMQILFDQVDKADFGLDYRTLASSSGGTRYGGQSFDPSHPTTSFKAQSVDFTSGSYGHKVTSSYVEEIREEVAVDQLAAPLVGTGNRVIGTSGIDALFGTAGVDILFGLFGDDALYGSLGADTMDGGDGKDTVSYYNSASAVDVDMMRAKQRGGGAEGDALVSIENVSGSGWHDRLFGDNSVNVLSGNIGDDVLNGRGGADVLFGGTGRDRFVFSSASEADGDFVADWNDGDSFDLSGIDADVVTVGMQSFRFVTSQGFSSTAGEVRLSNDGMNSFVSGDTDGDGQADFTIRIAGVQSSIAGVSTLQGQQWVVANGTDGNDVIYGTSGNDRVNAGIGDDVMYGSLSADEINGEEGNDAVSYFASGVGVNVDLNRVFQTGGFAEGDALFSIERIGGSAFNDVIRGDANGNVLSGNAGDDVIEGGDGPDWMLGEAGNDRFVFGPDSGNMYGDRVGDWNAGDVLDFSLIDADSNSAGDQGFDFIGTAAFSSRAGEMRVSNDGTDTFLTGDMNGDGIADFTLTLTGVQTFGLTSDWLIA